MNYITKVFFYIIMILIITGCVSATPVETASKVISDFGANQQCIDMFNAGPVNCQQDRKLCVGLVSYQEVAQDSRLASFAIAKDENNNVRLCTWSSAGFLRGRDYVDNFVLSSCEKQRLTLMSRTQSSLLACEIYAHDNDIL